MNEFERMARERETMVKMVKIIIENKIAECVSKWQFTLEYQSDYKIFGNQTRNRRLRIMRLLVKCMFQVSFKLTTDQFNQKKRSKIK